MDPNLHSQEAADDQLSRNLEYNESTNVGELHAAILREKLEPSDGMEPVPLWLITFFCLVIFWAGGYLFYYSGGFRSDVFDEDMITWGPVTGGPGAKVDPVAKGKSLFVNNCAACHTVSGEGVAGQYPSLVGSEQVLGAPNRLVHFVLHGLQGPLVNKGITYNGNMPNWNTNLKDDQIAYILTYVRQEWGNKASAITPEGVAAIRKESEARNQPYTWNEILAIPAAELPGAAAPAAAPTAVVPAAAK